MPRPRFSLRTMMAMVLVLGIILHLGLSAWRVQTTKAYHVHTSIVIQRGEVPAACSTIMARPPFWARYWRCVLGRPWQGRGLCPRDDHGLLEMCELDNPEIRGRSRSGTIGPHLTPGQRDLFQRLLRQVDPRYTVYADRVEWRREMPHAPSRGDEEGSEPTARKPG
jgi:hypothetical protein